MSKMLLVADTHLGVQQSSDFYHELVYTLFKEIRDFCLKNDIHRIIHLGDFFDEKKALNSKTQHVAHRIADLFHKAIYWPKLYIIVGNHDIYFKENLEPTALDVFKNYPHITIVNETTELDDGDIVLCPWSVIPTGYRSGYCFGHFQFVGFKMNNNYTCEIGQEPEDIFPNDFKHIYSGHFHTPSTQKKITYIGSAYPQTFNDIDSPRGYYIWDDGILDFIEFKAAPKFVKIKTDNINKNEIKGNIVKLIFTEDYGSIKNQQIIDEVISYNPTKIHPDFSRAKLEGTEEILVQNLQEAGLLDHPEIVNAFLDRMDIPKHLNKKTIKIMMEKLKGDE